MRAICKCPPNRNPLFLAIYHHHSQAEPHAFESNMQPLDHLTPPRTLVRNALLSTPSSRVAFLPIIQQETIYNSSNRSFQPSAEVDLKSILGFIEDSFPVLQRCSPRYVATWADSSNADSKVILIHGRIADALLLASASGPQSISALAIQFLVVVNVVHQLAHAMRTRFDCRTRSTLDSTHSPYYVDDGVSRTYPEAGFLVEDKLFGGVVGVVFKNETRGDRPPFFELDFTEIDYFFLLRQNESGNEAAYRIGMCRVHNSLHPTHCQMNT